MSSELLTAEQVAGQLGLSVNVFKRRAAAEDWPCVRFSARTIRYRAEHVEAIIALHETTPTTGAAFGQTARSRRRSA